MKQTSDTQNNELLNRLRENVASSISEEIPTEDAVSAEAMTPEQLLDQLKTKMGDHAATEMNGEHDAGDYDISGYEIEEQIVTEASQPTLTMAQEDAVTAFHEDSCPVEPAVSSVLRAENDLPWEAEKDDDVVAVEEKNDKPAEGSSPDEFDASLEETVEDSEQEALKRQIELFVEKTVEPDEVFDYFDGLEKKATRQRKEVEEPKSIEAIEEIGLPEVDVCMDETATETLTASSKEEAEEDLGIAPEAERFFFSASTLSQKQEQSCVETKAIDDTDINLLLALGQKHTLEQSLGFARVRGAKNNFYDPTDEESLGNHIFAYDGEEFRDPAQAVDIKSRYRREKKALWLRFVGTVLLGLAALFIDCLHNVPSASALWGGVFGKSVIYQAISLLLLLGGMVVSSKRVIDGARGFFTLRPNRYTPLSMISLTHLLYGVVLLLFYRDLDVYLYSFAVLAFLALSIIGDAIRLTRETLTFDVISSPKDKYALEKADPLPEMSREEKILSKRDLLVEKVSFVGKYFARTARRSVAHTEYFIEYLVSLVAASFVAIGTAALKNDLSAAFNAFAATLLIIMPMQYLIGSYSFGRLAKLLYRHESAVIGEAVDQEYVGANTVYLDDTEVFGLHGVSVSGLRTYNDANFYEVLYHAFAVFSRIEGPLQHVLDNSAQEIQHAKDVELIKIHSDGIEALVDGKSSILIGNSAFMKNKGFKPKQTDEDDQRVENGETSILYMAIDGILCAKFYMKYNITKRFETFVNEMYENATTVGIRTLDPGVSEEMIARIRKDKETIISVVRPTVNDLVPIGRRSDSGIITAKNSHMIARILALCGRVKRINHLCALLRIGSMVLSLVAVCVLLFTGLLTRIPAALIVIYHLLWLIPSSVYTARKLK